RTAERAPDRGGRRPVEHVVVAEGLALEGRGAGREGAVGGGRAGPAVPRGRLVRVLAVAEGLHLLQADREARGERIVGAGQAWLVRQVDAGGGDAPGQLRRDPRVVGGRVAERLDRE